jgi:hypothetical protein
VSYQVSKVYHFMNRSGQHGYHESDLIFIDCLPHVIIDWNGNGLKRRWLLIRLSLLGRTAQRVTFTDLRSKILDRVFLCSNQAAASNAQRCAWGRSGSADKWALGWLISQVSEQSSCAALSEMRGI